MTLNDIVINGLQPEPPLVMVYGPEGKGKSTFGATLPNPIIVDTEGKIGHIVAPKTPVPKDTEQVLRLLTMILREDHNYKSLVIDSVDGLDKIFCDTICKANGAKEILDTHIKALSFGGGYRMVRQQWGEILNLLLSIHKQRKMIICLIGHAQIYNFEDPENAPYDRYTLKMHSNGKDCSTAQMLFEWVNVIGFIREKRQVVGEDVGFNREVKRVQGSGVHSLALEHRPSFIAKNHYNLPSEINWLNPPTWDELGGLIREFWKEKLGKNDKKETTSNGNVNREGEGRVAGANTAKGNAQGGDGATTTSGEGEQSSGTVSDRQPDNSGEGRRPSEDSEGEHQEDRRMQEALDEAIRPFEEGGNG